MLGVQRLDGSAFYSGSKMPKWKGVAYYDLLYDSIIIAPIGLNKVIGVARRCIDWSRRGIHQPSNFELDQRIHKRIQLVKESAFRDGFIQGQTESYARGFKDGKDALLTWMESKLGVE